MGLVGTSSLGQRRVAAWRTAERAGVLSDPMLDARLGRDGFVTFRLLDAGEADALRREYGRLHGWRGEGFESDLVVADPAYRRAVRDAIAAATDAAVTRVAPDRVPFLRNFVVKYPGPASDLYLHRDWMYVDERTGGRTHVVWIALEDITGHNGQLRVLRGSHLLDRMARGTDLIAPWLAHADVIEPRLLSVPVRAGECVVFDNRLVHCSFPNHTGRPRVAAAIGVRPAGASLVHLRRRDEGTADRYDVDEDFFIEQTPQGLLAAAPMLPVAEVVEVRADHWSADELAARLDAGLLARADRLQHGLRSARRRADHLARTGAARARELAGTDIGTTGDGSDPPADADRSERAPAPGLLGQLAGALRPGAAGTERASSLPPNATRADRVRAIVDDLPTKAAIVVLGLNEATVSRFGPDSPAVWDPSRFDWARRVEAGFPEVRAEVDALLAGPVEIPHIEDVTGGIPQGNIGPWRSFVLMHQGRWMDWNCERCPRTTELVRSIPGLTMAGFSVLEPGTHITEHRGPNKGALRYQLGVVVPGDYGDCRIRVGEDMLVWQEGEGVMFDFTVPHEAWNDSDGIRVLLMLEVITPGLPWYLRHTNAAAQRAMGWFPTTRDMAQRLKQLEPQLQRTAP